MSLPSSMPVSGHRLEELSMPQDDEHDSGGEQEGFKLKPVVDNGHRQRVPIHAAHHGPPGAGYHGGPPRGFVPPFN